MASLFALAAPIALLLPWVGQASERPNQAPLAQLEQVSAEPAAPDATNNKRPLVATYPPAPTSANPLDTFRGGQILRQIRIERRVIFRVQPYRSRGSNQFLARLPQRELTRRFKERKMDKCLPVSGIAGVQTGSGNRLLLFLRDQRIVTVNLEKACRARDFYSGFYVEKNDDGKLCVDRDQLQSRTGVKCEVERMRQLVAVTD